MASSSTAAAAATTTTTAAEINFSIFSIFRTLGITGAFIITEKVVVITFISGIFGWLFVFLLKKQPIRCFF